MPILLAVSILLGVGSLLAGLFSVTAREGSLSEAAAEPAADALAQTASDAAGRPAPSAVAARRERRCPRLGEVVPELVDAAACGDTSRMAALLAGGTAIDETDPRGAYRGFSPLHHAVARGDRRAIEMLLQAGAAADLSNAAGNAPLHLLALQDKIAGDDGIARSLVHAGADVARRNAGGRSVLDELRARPRLARARGELARYLEETSRQQGTVSQARNYLGREASAEDQAAILEMANPTTDPAHAKAPDAGGDEAADRAIRERIAAWAEAWSHNNADAYLASYDGAFAVPGGRSRQAWEALRRKRIAAAGRISVSVTELELEIGPERATARFVQTYHAPGYQKEGPKTLVLARRPDGWAIVEEHDGH